MAASYYSDDFFLFWHGVDILDRHLIAAADVSDDIVFVDRTIKAIHPSVNDEDQEIYKKSFCASFYVALLIQFIMSSIDDFLIFWTNRVNMTRLINNFLLVINY